MVSTSANNLNTSVATSPFDYKNLIEGNARLIGLSNRLLVAHVAHAGLIMFWAGSITVSQAINYDPTLPLSEQGLALISNLARLGWGVGENGGIYDPAVGNVCLVTPNLNPADIFGYLAGLTPDGWNVLGIASVNNLEDVVGGHVWIGVMLIAGNIFHILVKSPIVFPIRLNADAILSYSIGSLAFMAFVSWAFVSYHTTVFPSELYGTAQLKGRSAVQFGLGLLFLGGHLWHAYRGIAADKGKPLVSLTS